MKDKIKELEKENEELKKKLDMTEKLATAFAKRSFILGLLAIIFAVIILLMTFK